ncbi:TetR/AcrR family transcriptional regulator [Paenibacillus sp. HB172176]|uniref:TetR/AcrR family transcriptional regulator n=1 Tax=Paenibacillus sp. HB172176 TaxID=2493690 RepID=UPI001F0F8FB6|nr:TetR/AcrR family transcriptional regulator [Paenibacillus sp. HB172176]
MAMNKHSLRDIKREATADALAEAAYELTMERGLDGFTVEDIVQRAGYARRTFANYFSCKEEAVAKSAAVFKHKEEAEQLIANLPDSATPLDLLSHLLRMKLVTIFLIKMRDLMRLSKRYPTIEPYLLSVLHQHQLIFQELLSQMFGSDYPARYLQQLAGAVYGAALPLLDGSVQLPHSAEDEKTETVEEHAADSMTLEHYWDDLFEHLRNGFSVHRT